MRRYRTLLTFVAIGIINTLVDVCLFLTLKTEGLPIIVANIISTSAALLTSYVLNRRFTFQSVKGHRQAVLPFLLVTLGGIWILQPIVIYTALHLLHTLEAIHILPAVLHAETLQDVVAKLAASGASLVWNFLLYKRFVFGTTALKTIRPTAS